jgi:hypothetical protein
MESLPALTTIGYDGRRLLVAIQRSFLPFIIREEHN